MPSHPRAASTPESTPVMRQTISGRDAFQDLDTASATSGGDPDSPTALRPLASHGFDVASQAAAMKGLTLSRTPSTGRYRSVSPLPTLPDVPARVPSANGHKVQPQDAEETNGQEDVTKVRRRGNVALRQEPQADPPLRRQHLPSPPTHKPDASPRMGSSSLSNAADTSIEIGVGGASAEQMEKMRAMAAQREEQENPEAAAPSSELDHDVGEMSSSSIIVSAPEGEEAPSSSQAPAATNGASQPSTPQKQQQLPSQPRVAVTPSISDISTSSSSASSMLPQTPAAAVPMGDAGHIKGGAMPSPTAARANLPLGPSTVTNVTPKQPASANVSSQEEASNAASTPLPAATPTAAAPSSLSPTATRSVTRNKSVNRHRPPPPGQPISLADLDASDDEYEPGWASVISTSRAG